MEVWFDVRAARPPSGAPGGGYHVTLLEARQMKMETRKPTEAEVEATAEALIDQDIYALASCLVDDLLQLGGENLLREGSQDLQAAFAWDNAQGLYPDPAEWTVDDCQSYWRDYGSGEPEIDDPEDVEQWRELVRDSAEPAEVYEWYQVSEHLARELGEIGQPVLSNNYGEWWGRTCSGQMIIRDGTMQEIARRILSYHPE